MGIWYTLVYPPQNKLAVQALMDELKCTFHPACPTYMIAGFHYSTVQPLADGHAYSLFKAARNGVLRQLQITNTDIWPDMDIE
jgi:hypothetical protein